MYIGRIRFRKNNDQVIALIARREFHETSIGHFIVIQAVIILPDESGFI
jgi:pyridoxine 5'-phosphate synthase PdxJ